MSFGLLKLLRRLIGVVQIDDMLQLHDKVLNSSIMSHQAVFSAVEALPLQVTIEEIFEKPWTSKACYLDVWDRGACYGSKACYLDVLDRGACCQVNWKEVLSQDARNKGYDNVKDEFYLSSGLDTGWKDDWNIGEYQLLLVTNSNHRKMMIIPLSRGVKDGRLTSVIILFFLYVEQ